MTPPADPARYKNHRFPGEIISHGVWLYYRFPLSYRDVQELLCERGIDVTHEAIRQWYLKFGQDYANQLKHRRPRPGDKWHLDEVFLGFIQNTCQNRSQVTLQLNKLCKNNGLKTLNFRRENSVSRWIREQVSEKGFAEGWHNGIDFECLIGTENPSEKALISGQMAL